jgi:hypothetical protein
MKPPTRAILEDWVRSRYASLDIPALFEYLHPDEYSYRRIQQCIYLQIEDRETWIRIVQKRREERKAAEDLKSDLVPAYQAAAFHPGSLLQTVLEREPELLGSYGECLELAGSSWAFLSHALSSQNTMAAV